MKDSKQPPAKDDAAAPVSGKVVRNEAGKASWQFKLDDGTYSSDVDTQRALKALNADDLALFDDTVKQPTLSDPYNKSGIKPKDETVRRRSLDDLRKLSEEIVKSKEYKRSK